MTWNDLDFPSDQCIELEIGCGRGEFLIEIARENPLSRFVGIEIAPEKCREAEQKISEAGISNARVVNGEAYEFMVHLPDSCISSVHLYFPSPRGLKELGLKHWAFTLSFSNEIHRILIPKGTLRIVTSHERYFARMERILKKEFMKWCSISWIPPLLSLREGIVGTPWERKVRKLEYSVFKMQFQKRGSE